MVAMVYNSAYYKMKNILKPLMLVLIPFLLFSCKNEGINGEKSDLTVADSCGNTYSTVKVADQIWMAENLRADKDAQGIAIDETQICNPNNDEANVPVFGKLYSWEAAQNVCPEGWRLPTKDEAKTLINTMGDADIAGAKLSGEQSLWNNLADDTNTVPEHFGEGLFNAVPAGYLYNNEYYGFGYNTSFWCSTLDDSENAQKLQDPEKKVYAITLSYNDAKVGAIDRNFGLSVRCVKEN